MPIKARRRLKCPACSEAIEQEDVEALEPEEEDIYGDIGKEPPDPFPLSLIVL